MNEKRKDLSVKEKLDDFSLVLGGPLYQIWRRTRLLEPALDLLIRRIVTITLLAWLPLLFLAFLSGNALEGVPVPFLQDLDAHARFLVAVPLLIAAEIFAHQRLGPLVRQFLDRDIVVPEDRPRFEDIVNSTLKLRNSVLAEVLIILFVWTVGHWVWREHTSLRIATWYAMPAEGGIRLTPAGYWYAFVSIPIFQFLLCRWYYRLGLWYRFLWKASRLKLRLVVTHPDGAGGIGFLGVSVYAFAPVLLVHTILLAGRIANRIWHESASLLDYKPAIAGLVVLLLSSVFLPLTAFSRQLLRAKRVGMSEFGALAERYNRGFDAKWIRGGAPEGEELLGTSDIQSLADLAYSHDVARSMWAVPFRKELVLRLALLLILPVLPLTLTIIPVEKMLDKLLGILL